MDSVENVVEKTEEDDSVSCWWHFRILVKYPNTQTWYEEDYIHNILINPLESLKPVYISWEKEKKLITKVIFKEGGYIYLKNKPLNIGKKIELELYKVN